MAVRASSKLIRSGTATGRSRPRAVVLRQEPVHRTVPVTIAGERRMMHIVEVPLGNSGVAGYAIDVEDREQARSELARFVHAQRDMLDRLSAGVAQFARDRGLIFSNQPFAPGSIHGPRGLIAAATIRARLEGVDVVGIRDGFEWLLQGDIEHVTPLTIEAVSHNVPTPHKELAPATLKANGLTGSMGALASRDVGWPAEEGRWPGVRARGVAPRSEAGGWSPASSSCSAGGAFS